MPDYGTFCNKDTCASPHDAASAVALLLVPRDVSRPETASGCTAELVDDTDRADCSGTAARNQVGQECQQVRRSSM